jgi:hypothetical protein
LVASVLQSRVRSGVLTSSAASTSAVISSTTTSSASAHDSQGDEGDEPSEKIDPLLYKSEMQVIGYVGGYIVRKLQHRS